MPIGSQFWAYSEFCFCNFCRSCCATNSIVLRVSLPPSPSFARLNNVCACASCQEFACSVRMETIWFSFDILPCMVQFVLTVVWRNLRIFVKESRVHLLKTALTIYKIKAKFAKFSLTDVNWRKTAPPIFTPFTVAYKYENLCQKLIDIFMFACVAKRKIKWTSSWKVECIMIIKCLFSFLEAQKSCFASFIYEI